MRIFLSYASEKKAQAEAIAFSLRSRAHKVFLDRDDLSDGVSHDDRIAIAVEQSDLMIFLISPESVASGRYTLTELRFARAKWPSPSARVLPIMVASTPMASIPTYLKAVSILEPQGNLAAEVAFAVDRLRGRERARHCAALSSVLGVAVAILAGLMPVVERRYSFLPPVPTCRNCEFGNFAPENGLILGLFVGSLFWWLGERRWWRLPVIWLAASAGWIVAVIVYFNFLGGPRLFNQVPTEQLSALLKTLSEPKSEATIKAIDALQAYLTWSDKVAFLILHSVVVAASALTVFLFVFAAFAIVDRAFRNVTRLLVGILLSMFCGVVGVQLSSPLGFDSTSRPADLIWPFNMMDVAFAAVYLPWLVVIPPFFAYWLVRGQQT